MLRKIERLINEALYNLGKEALFLKLAWRIKFHKYRIRTITVIRMLLNTTIVLLELIVLTTSLVFLSILLILMVALTKLMPQSRKQFSFKDALPKGIKIESLKRGFKGR